MAAIRKLIWIEKNRLHGFGCSACAWVFRPSDPPTGNSFDEMKRNFELQRDNEFTSHVCAEHPHSQERKKLND
jgi:rubredoxin